MNTCPLCLTLPGERHFFVRCYTPFGIQSFIDHIFRNDEISQYVYLLKGGSFQLRSEVLEKVSEYMLGKGKNVEIMHNSINPQNLDLIYLPEKGMSLINGFSGSFYEKTSNKTEIEIVNINPHDYYTHDIDTHIDIRCGNNEDYYEKASRYLRAAANIIREQKNKNVEAYDLNELLGIAEGISMMLFDHYHHGDEAIMPGSRKGKIRRFFSDAVTADGVIDLKKAALSGMEIIGVKGGNEYITGPMLYLIADRAVNNGYDIEVFHSSLFPNIINHITVPYLKTAISIIGQNETGMMNYSSIIDIKDYSSSENEGYDKSIEAEIADRLIDMAVNTFSSENMQISQKNFYSSPNMCRWVNRLAEKIIKIIQNISY